jgi:Zn ribbon nucleic-acid-binding protein
MGWRFRKSINLGGGVRLNLGKRSAGVSFGGRGARVSINSSGRRTVTLGIPGTGLYWQKSTTARRKSNAHSAQRAQPGCLSSIATLIGLGIVVSLVISVMHFIARHWLVIVVIVTFVVAGGTAVARTRRKAKKQQTISIPCPKCSTQVQIPIEGDNSSVHVQCPSCGAAIQANLHFERPTTESVSYHVSPAIQRYYELFNLIEESRSSHDYRRVLELSLESISLLPEYVSACVKEFGEFDNPPAPCLSYVCRYLSAIPDETRLLNVREIIAGVPQLASWLEMVDDAIDTCKLTEKVYAYLESNPGCPQRHLGKTLNEDGRRIANIIHYAEQLGRIKRVPFQRTYQLYLATLD